jgi:hypothetical protein
MAGSDSVERQCCPGLVSDRLACVVQLGPAFWLKIPRLAQRPELGPRVGPTLSSSSSHSSLDSPPRRQTSRSPRRQTSRSPVRQTSRSHRASPTTSRARGGPPLLSTGAGRSMGRLAEHISMLRMKEVGSGQAPTNTLPESLTALNRAKLCWTVPNCAPNIIH